MTKEEGGIEGLTERISMRLSPLEKEKIMKIGDMFEMGLSETVRVLIKMSFKQMIYEECGLSKD